MKRIQFSLSTLLLAMVFAWAFISCIVQFVSVNAEAAFEQLLYLVWLSSLVLSFGRSTAQGWKRIVRATIITGAVWSTSIGLYLLVAFLLGLYSFSFLELLTRLLAVSVAGAAAALLGACILQIMVLTARCWRSATMTKRVACSAAVLACAMALLAWSYVARNGMWKPSITARSDAEPAAVPDLARQIAGKHGLWVIHGVSPDRRFVAGRDESPSIKVFDMATWNMVAELRVPEGQVFLKPTFLADSSALVAIPTASRTTGTVLFRWATDTWEEEDRLDFSRLPDDPPGGLTFPILTDRALLLVYVDDSDPARTQFELSTVDLLEDCRIEKFASTTANLAAPVGLRDALLDWTVAPDHGCIISPEVFERGYHWVFRRGSNKILKFRGEPLAILSKDNFIVVSEAGGRLAVRSRDKGSSSRSSPPFWYPPWDLVFCHRVSILDSRTGQRIARSGWWECPPPTFDPASGTVKASQWKQSLTWDVSAVLQDP